MQRIRFFATLTLALMLLSACNLPGGPAPVAVDVNAIYTAAAVTLAAQQTQNAAAQPTTPPTDTPVPATPTSAEPPTPEFTPTPSVPPATPTSSVPMAIVDTNSNCRKGPSTAYDPPVAVLRSGDQAEIQGRNPDRSWWYVQIPGKPGQFCWIWGNNVNVSGDTSNVQVVTPPPVPITPTFTPTPDVGFDATYASGVEHDCNSDPYAVFEIDNEGELDFESMRIRIINRDNDDEEISDDDSNDPFLSATNQCPEGDDTLKDGDTAWVAGNIDDASVGDDATAIITLCTKEGLDGICVTQEVDFEIKL